MANATTNGYELDLLAWPKRAVDNLHKTRSDPERRERGIASLAEPARSAW